MVYIDVHNHIDFYPDEEIEKIVNKCKSADIKKILVNGTDLKSNKKILKLSKKFPEIIPCFGIYPVEGVEMTTEEFNKNLDFIKSNKDKIVGIGEVGLDLKETTSEQGNKK